MQLYVISRAFEGAAGRQYTPGEVVDVSGWRNTAGLVSRRFIRPAVQSEITAAGLPAPEIVAAPPARGRKVPDNG